VPTHILTSSPPVLSPFRLYKRRPHYPSTSPYLSCHHTNRSAPRRLRSARRICFNKEDPFHFCNTRSQRCGLVRGERVSFHVRYLAPFTALIRYRGTVDSYKILNVTIRWRKGMTGAPVSYHFFLMAQRIGLTNLNRTR
jgi:hypothetical protein